MEIIIRGNDEVKRNNINLGIMLGIFLGLFISMLWAYNLIWGKTFFGVEIFSKYATNQKIALYQIFQDIRDPENAEYKDISYFSKDLDAHLYIKRKLVINGMLTNDVLIHYAEEISKYHEFKIDYSNKIISFSKLLEDNHKIEGLVRVVQDNPVLVEITIRR